ncbi:MAG TPA: arylsulfatase [Candidatus Hydrogenedentes bacterium]|nr:arylsulfatase [Candidatus Hydrogenedentota bacterium]HPG70052.1 arylsulfatase [Candidatus Hydrogenedentota bacterium]
MNRREFLRTLGHAACVTALTGASAPERNALRPNIVLILADDMGFGDLACQNPESKIPTPNLDRLAQEGIRFTDAHSPSAVCSPTRYGILTGCYCWRSPLKSSVLWSWDQPLIAKDTLTLPSMLKERGYATACVGKWHLGWEWPTRDGSCVNDSVPIGGWKPEVRDTFGAKVDFSRAIGGGPTTRGFDYYFGDDVPNFPPYVFIENDRTLGIPSVEKPKEMFGSAGPMLEGWDLEAVMPALTQKAVDFIKAAPDTPRFGRPSGTPFFLYFPLTAPHCPIAPTKEFLGQSQAGRYGDFVCEVDWTVGQVMKALEETGQTDNTLIIFTSDNGSPGRDGTDMGGKPNSVLKYGHHSSYIYRGIKADIWDGGHREPFIARWPGHIPPASVSDELVCLVDLMATCAAIVDYRLPREAAVDSFDILPALTNAELDAPIREAVVHHSIDGMFAIRQGKWKLVLGKGSGGWSGKGDESDPPGQLYDMEQDVAEQKNLYGEHPEIVERLQALLDTYRTTGRNRP